MCDTDIAAGVTLLCELTHKELIELSAENTVSDKLSFLADLRSHCDPGLRGVESIRLSDTPKW
jgi:hypothetical protein